MKIQFFTTPWSHCIIDNLFDDHQFNIIQEYINSDGLHRNVSDGTKIVIQDDLPQSIFSDKKVVDQELPQHIINIFRKKNFEIYRLIYEKLWSTTDNKLVDQELDINEFNMQNRIDFVSCGENYYYPVHTDIAKKRLSSVFYGGILGNGTVLCSKDESKIVDWLPNRCLSFIPQTCSWHYYGNYSNEIRYTFNMLFVKSNGSNKNFLYS